MGRCRSRKPGQAALGRLRRERNFPEAASVDGPETSRSRAPGSKWAGGIRKLGPGGLGLSPVHPRALLGERAVVVIALDHQRFAVRNDDEGHRAASTRYLFAGLVVAIVRYRHGD